MSLRDRIKHVIDCVEDQDDSVCMDAAADAILALLLAHLTSDEAGDIATLHAEVERLREVLQDIAYLPCGCIRDDPDYVRDMARQALSPRRHP